MSVAGLRARKRRLWRLAACAFAVGIAAVPAHSQGPGTPGTMDGKGTLRDGASTASYSFFLDCRASHNAGKRLGVRFDRSRFTLHRVTSMRCLNDRAIPTPAAGFDTMRGAGTGTLTSGGRSRPGYTVGFKFVDDARGNPSDRSAIRIESPRGRAVFSASGRLGARQSDGCAISQTTDGDARARCDEGEPECSPRGSCGPSRPTGTGYNRARKIRNGPPTGIALSNRSVPENRPAGTRVGRFTTADRDRGDTHAYRLVSGPGAADNGSFRIDGSTLRTSTAFDFERKSSYSIRVRATDGRGGRFEKTFRITVGDVGEAPPNQAPTDISLSASTVDENEPSGTEVGTLSTADPDSADPHAYSLVSGAGDGGNGSFEIDGSKLKTKAAFDFEVKASYSIRVRTDDGRGGTFEKTFTIDVENANDPPTDISLSPSDVDENEPAGTDVGNLSTADQDSSDTHAYSLVSGTGDADNGSFEIDGAKLKTKAAFDFEVKASYSIRVRTSDGQGGTFEKQLTITVTNVNEAPTDISLSDSTVAENEPTGTEVGTLSTADPDAGDTHTYSLVAGTGDADNGSFEIDGSKLKTKAAFDFEVKASYSIRVRTSDGQGGTFEKIFTIGVENANDPPTDISLSASTVDENEPSGTEVGNLSTADQDSADTHAYSLVSGTGDADNASFEIDGSKLKTKASFNFEVKASYSVRLRSTDGGTPAASHEEAFTITVNDVNDAPVADDESFSGASRAVGNTSLVVNDSSDGAQDPTGPQKTISGDILAGDTDEDGSGTLAVEPGTLTTNDGGSVTVESDGDFTFHPKAGTSCTDNSDFFDYTLSDQNLTKPPGTPGTDTGRVTIEIADCVWYVDRSAASDGDGRSHSPFNALDATGGNGVNGAAGAGDSDTANQTIFLYDGSYPGGLPLENGQALLSERHGLSVSDGGAGSVTLVPAGGSNTTLTGGLTLGQNNTIQGIHLGNNGSGAALSGTSVGTANMNTATSGAIDNQTGKGVDISDGALSMAFTGVSSKDSTSDGIRLDNVSGTFGATGGSIENAGDQDVDITGNNSGDTANITYGGSITDDTGRLVNVSGQNGGTKDFNGALDDGNDGDGSGVSLSSNTGATVRFDGGLTLSTGSNPAFTATGGGTVNVCDEDPCTTGTAKVSKLTTAGATALKIANTNIGSSGLAFRSISANGGPNGIVLDDTGTTAGLTVTGNGGTCTNSDTSGCSGGTIRNTTGSDDAGATPTGTGVVLNNTRDVSLTRMNMRDHSNYALRGTGVTNLTLANSVINGTNGTNSTTPFDDGSVKLNQLTGSASVTNTHIEGGTENNVGVSNSSGTLNRLAFSGVTVGPNSTAAGNDGITVEGVGSSTVNVTVENSTFTSSRADLFQMIADGTGGGDLSFTGNTLTNNHPGIGTGGGGVSIFGGQSGVFTVNFSNNTLRDAVGHALLFVKSPPPAAGPCPADPAARGTLRATVNANQVGVAAVPNSGSLEGDGVKAQQAGCGTLTTAITNNQIRQYNNQGIQVQAGAGIAYSGTVNSRITGNTVSNPGTNASIDGVFQGVHLNNGVTPGDNYQTCWDVKGNSANASGRNGGTDFRTRSRQSGNVRLPGFSGNATDDAALAAFVANQNDANANDPAANPPVPTSSILSAGTFSGGAACASP